MPRHLAVDSSPLILLGRISRLDLLPALADRVVVPRPVLRELSAKNEQDWLASTVSAHPGIEVSEAPPVPAEVARWNIGAGESAVIGFCLANAEFRAVLDDQRGRRCAQALGVPLFGTLGVIVTARREGLITAARPLIAAIQAIGYRIDDRLVETALSEVGES